MKKPSAIEQRRSLNRILFTLILMPLSLVAQNKETYSLNGKIGGLKENEKITMRLVAGSDFVFEDRDSGYVKNGEFSLSGHVPKGPREYWMVFDKHPGQYVMMFIDNGEHVSINCTQDIGKILHSNIHHFMTIDGSPSNTAIKCLTPMLAQYRQALGLNLRLLDKIKDSIGFNPSVVDPIFTLMDEIKEGIYISLLINVEPDYVKAIPVLADEGLIENTNKAWYWKIVYDNLDERLKISYSGERLKKKVALCVGQPFPEFSLPTSDGKQLTLKDFINKNKITIVQFWASNSYKVDKYQEELLAMYKKYQNKGLNIVGISSDTVLNKWKAGILRNDVPWSQVSDLKGINGIVANIYNEYGDPKMVPNTTNVLIDENGKILAWDISGLQLQWFLWKRLDNMVLNTTANN